MQVGEPRAVAVRQREEIAEGADFGVDLVAPRLGGAFGGAEHPRAAPRIPSPAYMAPGPADVTVTSPAGRGGEGGASVLTSSRARSGGGNGGEGGERWFHTEIGDGARRGAGIGEGGGAMVGGDGGMDRRTDVGMDGGRWEWKQGHWGGCGDGCG